MSSLTALGLMPAAADSSEEVQRLRLLVKKLEQQNNLLRARSLSSGLSDCGVERDADNDFDAASTGASTRLHATLAGVPDSRKGKGMTLDDVSVLDMDTDSLDEEDSWLYVSPSKSLINGSASRKNAYDADEEVAWATDNPSQSPHVWLRQDLDNPSPEVRMVRRSLAFTLEELMHAPSFQPSASAMYSRGGSGMARSAADLSTSGRMSPAIKPALLGNTASLDAGTFIKARRNILTSAGSTPDVGAMDVHSQPPYENVYDPSPGYSGSSAQVSGKLSNGFAASSPHLSATNLDTSVNKHMPADSNRWASNPVRAGSPNVYGSPGQSNSEAVSNGLLSPDGYPSPINTGTFTRRRKVVDADPTTIVTNAQIGTRPVAELSAQQQVTPNPSLATPPTGHLSRSCDNIPAGHLTGRGIFVTASQPSTDASKPPTMRASCEALDKIQAMARMQEQSLREDVNSMRRNSISSGSATRLMSVGSSSQIASPVPPPTVASQGSPAFFKGPMPKASSMTPQLASSTRITADGISNWASVGGTTPTAKPAPAVSAQRAVLTAEVLAQQQLLQLQQQTGRGSYTTGLPQAAMAQREAGPAPTAVAGQRQQPAQQRHQYAPAAVTTADVSRSSRRSLPQTPAQAVPLATPQSTRGLSPSSREAAGSNYGSRQPPQPTMRPQSSAASSLSRSTGGGGVSNRHVSPPRSLPKAVASAATTPKRAAPASTSSRPPSQPSMTRRSGNGYF